jgi:hypothetical protein
MIAKKEKPKIKFYKMEMKWKNLKKNFLKYINNKVTANKWIMMNIGIPYRRGLMNTMLMIVSIMNCCLNLTKIQILQVYQQISII